MMYTKNETKEKNERKNSQLGYLLIGVLGGVILGIVVYCNESVAVYLGLFMGMFLFSLKFAKDLIEGDKFQKLFSIRWWICTCTLYILFLCLMNYEIGISEGFVLIIGFIIMFIESMRMFFDLPNNLFIEVSILLGWGEFLYLLALISMMLRYSVLFLAFKVMTLSMLICGLKISQHLNRLWGIICIIVIYSLMIIVNVTLSTQVLLTTKREFFMQCYLALRNMYSLPELTGTCKELLEISISFLICRIMDAVLIGCLVNNLQKSDYYNLEK